MASVLDITAYQVVSQKRDTCVDVILLDYGNGPRFTACKKATMNGDNMGSFENGT